uniref:Uncharacterized protein n=1 Tax=Oryza glumipatula TaxID=40148 RepID=A0A0D9Y926_9ORYZ
MTAASSPPLAPPATIPSSTSALRHLLPLSGLRFRRLPAAVGRGYRSRPGFRYRAAAGPSPPSSEPPPRSPHGKAAVRPLPFLLPQFYAVLPSQTSRLQYHENVGKRGYQDYRIGYAYSLQFCSGWHCFSGEVLGMGITIQEAQSANDSVRNREDPLSKFTGNTKVGAAPCQSSSDTPKEAGSMIDF